MLIIACGDSYTEGEGLDSQDQVYAHILAKKLKAKINNIAQSGASEYLILNQIEEAVKLKPDLIVVGHTSEYRWKVWDFRRPGPMARRIQGKDSMESYRYDSRK